MKALLEEMIPPAVAEQLRSRGHDVVAVAERPDLRTRPDHDVFAVAQVEGRVVITRDRIDYLAIDSEHRSAGRAHAGLVLVPSRYPETDVGSLMKALDTFLIGDAAYPSFVCWL